MRVLFVHERFGAFAGAEANLYQTAEELKRRGHTVGILHGVGTGRSEPAWREAFHQCFALEGRDNCATVQTALWEFRPDFIYMHKMADLEVLHTLVGSRIPIVHMIHDHDLYCMRSYKYHFLSRKICQRPFSPYCLFPCGASVVRDRGGRLPLRWVSYAAKKKEIELNQQCRRLVVATNYMKDELLRNGFAPEKIAVHAPVPPDGGAPLRSSFSERNRLIYAGQIVRGKGVDVLLEAMAQIDIPFECIILGDGNHKAFCEELSRKLGLESRVHFKGYVPAKELKSFYQECSVVVMSSVWPEPFGAAGLEGMRYGLPVVAFDAGGISEWLISGHNGYLVPWMDRAAFAGRVQELLVDKTLARQMGERGSCLVSQKFDFSSYISALENLFAQVVSEAQENVQA